MGEVRFRDSTLAESENVFIFAYNHSTAYFALKCVFVAFVL